MGDVKPLLKSQMDYVDILTDRVNEVLKPLGINSQTAMKSYRHMYIWFLVFDELREQLGYPVQQMIDLGKEHDAEKGIPEPPEVKQDD